ncbi:MAG: hypothetical protein KC493_08915 [Bacteriovoracaceae bacterium]|nr:hypothetical protein [Bacteriovoracaceae bacterium]
MKIILILIIFLSSSAIAEVRGVLKSKKGNLDDYSSFVIYIKEGKSFPKIKNKLKSAEMGQVNKKFTPAVVGVTKGQTIDFKNHDDVFHNVFSLDQKNKFDLKVYKGNERYSDDLKTPLKKKSTKVKFQGVGKTNVFCNIHEDMMGTVYVFDHGYFAMAKKSGLFSLPSPPPGKYTLIVDGDRLKKPISKKINFKRKMKRLIISFNPVDGKKAVSHKNKKGKKYKEKEWELDEDDFY